MSILDFWKKKELPAGGKNPTVFLLGSEKSWGQPLPKNFSQQMQEYKSWVYACANRNAYSVAKCALNLYSVQQFADRKEEKKQIFMHPFLDLMKNVNPFYNRIEIMTMLALNLEMTGNAYWWIPKGQLGTPAVIWNCPSDWMKVVPDEKNFISGYLMQVPGRGQLVPFDETEIIHFKYPDPKNLYYGISPLMAAGYAVDFNNELKPWAINFIRNNAQPSGILTTDDSLSDGQFKRLKEEWNNKYRGNENAGKLAVLEAGLKYQQIGSSLKDMNMEDLNKNLRTEICAIYGVPPSKLGVVEDVNRANAETNDYTYQKDTILPKLELIQEKINEKLLPLYDMNLICEFDNPVPEDKDFKLREREVNIRTGFASIDEERVKENLEPYDLPETSVPLLSFSAVPAGTPREDPNAQGEDTNPEDEEEDPDKEDDDEKEKPKEKPDKEKKSFQYAKRTNQWLHFIRSTNPIERLFRKALQGYFKEQYKEVASNLNKYKSLTKAPDSFNILFNIDVATKILEKLSAPHITEAITSGYELGATDLGVDISFDLTDINAIRAAEHRIAAFSKGVVATSADLIEKAVTEGLMNGESIADIAKRISAVYDYNYDFRSMRIARTEVSGAVNEGILNEYVDQGVEFKEWTTARDEKVRESHEVLDGIKVPVSDVFITGDGGHLSYPGDRDNGAEAGDIINCRCRIVAGDY